MAVSAGQPLEALVKDVLRGPVTELVRQVVVELVREQLNGNPQAVTEAAVSGPENPQTDSGEWRAVATSGGKCRLSRDF